MGEMVKTRIPRIENPLDSEWPETHARGGDTTRSLGNFRGYDVRMLGAIVVSTQNVDNKKSMGINMGWLS